MLLRPATLALLAGLTLAAPLAAADTTPAPIAAEHVTTDVSAQPAAPTADHNAASSYAQREATDKDASKFQGGSVVIIGASGGALIVLLILILLLV